MRCTVSERHSMRSNNQAAIGVGRERRDFTLYIDADYLLAEE